MQPDNWPFNPTLIFLIISVAAVPVFIFLIWKYPVRWTVALLIGLTLESILVAFYTVYAFGGAFGPGIVLFCLSPLIMFVAFLILLGARQPFLRAYPTDKIRQRVYLLGGLFVIGLQASPMLGNFAIDATCFTLTQQRAGPMITALETYRQDQGHYPEDLALLTPTYLPALPTPACSWLSENQGLAKGFALEQCQDDVWLLTVSSVGRSSIQRYNLSTGNWSSISFLDGACNFLR